MFFKVALHQQKNVMKMFVFHFFYKKKLNHIDRSSKFSEILKLEKIFYNYLIFALIFYLFKKSFHLGFFYAMKIIIQ